MVRVVLLLLFNFSLCQYSFFNDDASYQSVICVSGFIEKGFFLATKWYKSRVFSKKCELLVNYIIIQTVLFLDLYFRSKNVVKDFFSMAITIKTYGVRH